jgi:hypothetical protein
LSWARGFKSAKTDHGKFGRFSALRMITRIQHPYASHSHRTATCQISSVEKISSVNLGLGSQKKKI